MNKETARQATAGSRLSGCPKVALLLVLGLATIALLLVAGGVALAQTPSQREEGQQLFQQRCAACHTVGQGNMIGPDLKGVVEKREREWLVRFISTPDKLIAEKDPIATALLRDFNNIPMPNLNLAPGQVDALLAYLDEGKTETPAGTKPDQPATVTEPTPPPSPAGSVTLGKGLFTGSKRFENGGPPCLACHAVAGLGALGGGALGPDLTTTYARLGDAVATWPETMAPMRAIYEAKPLSPQEKTDLAAFFKATTTPQRSASATLMLFGLAIGGVFVSLASIGLVWRRRLGPVRRTMVDRSSSSR